MSARIARGVEGTLRPGRDGVMRRAVQEAARQGSWFVVFVEIALVVASMRLLDPVVPTNSWFWPVTITVAFTLAAVQTVRQLTANPLLAPVAGFVALVVTTTVIAHPQGLGDVVDVWPQRVAELTTQLASDSPPLAASAPVSLALAVVAGVLALLVDVMVVATPLRLFGTVPLLIPAAWQIAAGLPAADWSSWLLAVALWVALVFVTSRWQRETEDRARMQLGFTADGRGSGGLAGAVIGGTSAIAVAALVAAMLPAPSGTFWDAFSPQASLATNRVNPILDLGDDLQRKNPVELFRYATSQTSGRLPYFSLTTLGDLNGDDDWAPTDFTADEITRGGALTATTAVTGPSALSVNQNIVLTAGVSAYLPHSGDLSAVGDLVGANYGLDQSTGDLRSMNGDPLAQTYRVDSIVPTPSAGELAAIPVQVPSDIAALTDLPENAAVEKIRAVLESIVTPEATPFEQAQQLQSWFTNGQFTYSFTAPETGGFGRTNLDSVVSFLEQRTGYCIHFASAMAIMGRMLGIPTRIQVGTTPGSLESMNESGQPVYTVSTNDLHAWAEFWVAGYGWVPFETTPASAIGTTNIPQATDPAPSQDTSTETGPAEGESQTPTPTPTPTESDTAVTPEPTQAPAEGAPTRLNWWLIAGVAVVLLFGLALIVALRLPRIIRDRRRRTRAERVRHAPAREGALAGPDAQLAPATAAWRELIDTGIDFGLPVSHRFTSGRVARGFREALASDAPALDAVQRLRVAIEEERFAAPEHEVSTAQWADVETVASALSTRDATLARRARTRPESVLRSIRPRALSARARRWWRQKRASRG